MRLKKIRLAGFKSFVDPTNIPFPDDMTAIVGPNGCGKSNVIDAVRWVLGESSAKNLRGDAMTDVIFNGSTARKPVSQCSVELVFDNSSGRIQGEFANYVELSVKRVVTRDAQSNYFLNGSKCRRRDVTDLFLGTGLGPRSYAIIEQGMISRLIESKPQELRVFIEEAAGISKYKERRRETENRIRHTKENLDRLEDVRSELGQQIEKLQRQASAAKRYKELKQTERTLKAELAAMRWQKHSQQVTELESKISQQQSDIEQFVAKQRGDEKDIAVYRQQQLNLKQTLADAQQHNFQLGTEITKLEQNRLHAQQRTQQITKELAESEGSIAESLEFEQQEAQKLAHLKTQLAESEPAYELLAEQLDQAQESLQRSQDAMATYEQQWREQQQHYAQRKHQTQSLHSQIQATMNLQMRTQQRISELQQEQEELEHDSLAEQINSLEQQVAQAKGHFQHCKERKEDFAAQLDAKQQEITQLKQQLFERQGQLQQIDAQIAALESLQQDQAQADTLAETLTNNGVEFSPLWRMLEVHTGWEKAVERVTARWQQAYWLNTPDNTLELIQQNCGKLIWADKLSDNKPANSLAEKINNSQLPFWLTQILVADTELQAMSMLPSLQAGQSVVTPEGKWFGKDFIDLGDVDEQSGLIARAAKVAELKRQANELRDDVILPLANQQEPALQHLAALKDKLNGIIDEAKQAEQAYTQLHNQLNLLEMQQQQSLVRQTRLSEELSKQAQLLEDEKLQSEEYVEQLAESEHQLDILTEQQHNLEQQKADLVADEQQCRHQVTQLTERYHQLALNIQDLKSQQQGVRDAHTRSEQLVVKLRSKEQQLKQELVQLSQPVAEQQETLDQLLAKRVEVEAQLSEISDQLAATEQNLSQAEKGQQGVQEQVLVMRSELESKKLECEGYRVRANSTLEQLQDLKQPLKEILASMPEHADDQQWQVELEKTAAALGRLGAVNLAAVEEFEVQSQRKQHLDMQNQDLVDALETLESAIRKIDKETRARFKQTYDSVNEDLKALFPKVFGGGAAYLELTGDDLLETGVTIMARPPGKKNSTIHLLSGGEKALTALSLVFAIFRLNPAPFCLLDEVDAPLDDANVGRFCKLVSEMSNSVQFIYITHNKIAMEMAKHLTGVTMAEPGVSRMVAVDVEQAVAIAQA